MSTASAAPVAPAVRARPSPSSPKATQNILDAIEKLIAEKIEWLSGGLEDLPQAAESEERERPRNGRDRGGRDRDRDRSRGRNKGEARAHGNPHRDR
jgi:hypothetical protein